LPKHESHLWLHVFSLLSIFFSSHFQSYFLYSFGFRKKPKYFRPSSNLFSSKGKKILRVWHSSLVSKFVVRDDFPSLIFMHFALEKRRSILFIVFSSLLYPTLNINTSSTKRRWMRCKACETLIPEKEPDLLSSEIFPVRFYVLKRAIDV